MSIERLLSAMLLLSLGTVVLPLCGTGVAFAQDRDALDADTAPPAPPVRVSNVPQGESVTGRIVDSAAGRAGQRVTRDQATGIRPMSRISSRLVNRVQARLRTRIDRNYDPTANATRPFEVADEQLKRPEASAPR